MSQNHQVHPRAYRYEKQVSKKRRSALIILALSLIASGAARDSGEAYRLAREKMKNLPH